MHNLHTFYSDKVQAYKVQLSAIKQQLLVSSMVRLAVFIAAGITIFFVKDSANFILAVVGIAIVLFLFLVSRHSNLKYKKDKLLAQIKINETEIKVLNRDFLHLPDGEEFKNPIHQYSQDIDLFGKSSFYQYANRTVLAQGSENLAALFTENSITNIIAKQEAVKELAGHVDWR